MVLLSWRTDALVIQWLWRLPRMRETRVQSPIEALNFLVRHNPLLHLVANYRIHWLIWSKHEDTLPPEGSECHGGQMPWWSSGYDAHLECERPGSDPPLRHWIFRSVGTHCYIVMWPFFQKIFGGHKFFSWGHRYPCFGVQVMSPLGFKASVDPFACFLACVILRFTSGATADDWIEVSMAAESCDLYLDK